MPFAAAVPVLRAFIDDHFSAFLFTLTTLGFLGTMEYLSPGYLTMSDAQPTGPPFIIGPPIPTNLTETTFEIKNVTCRIVTDLTIFQPSRPTITFWTAFWQKFSFVNIREVTWDFVAIYDLIWDFVPVNLAPFIFLTIYLAATWQIWSIFFAVVRFCCRQVRRRFHEPSEIVIEVSSPDSSITTLKTVAMFWKLLARMWRKIANDNERDLKNARVRNVQFSKESSASQYQGQITKLQQQLDDARKNTFAEQATADEARKTKFDLQIRSKEFESAKKNLDASRRNLRVANARIQALEKSQAEATTMIAEKDKRLAGQASLLQSFKVQLDQSPSPQVLGLSSISSVAIEPLVSTAIETAQSEPQSSSVVTVVQGDDVQTETAKNQSSASLKSNVLQAELAAPTVLTQLATIGTSPTPATELAPKSLPTDGDSKKKGSPVDTKPKAVPKKDDAKKKVAKNSKVAAQKYRAVFPNGFTKIWVSPKDWLCGLEAVIKTMEAMYPGRQQPTLEELKTICNSSVLTDALKHADEAGVSTKNYFSPDILELVVRAWGMKHGLKYRIGYIVPDGNGYQPSLCIGEDDDDYSEDIIWVYLHFEVIEGFEVGHYSGVKPDKETDPKPEEMINVEVADPTPEDFQPGDEEAFPSASATADSIDVQETDKSSERLQDSTDAAGPKEDENRITKMAPINTLRSKVIPAVPKVLPEKPASDPKEPLTLSSSSPPAASSSPKQEQQSEKEPSTKGTRKEQEETILVPNVRSKSVLPVPSPTIQESSKISTHPASLPNKPKDQEAVDTQAQRHGKDPKTITSKPLKMSKWTSQDQDNQKIDTHSSETVKDGSKATKDLNQGHDSNNKAHSEEQAANNDEDKTVVAAAAASPSPSSLPASKPDNTAASESDAASDDTGPDYALSMADIDPKYKPSAGNKRRFEQWNRLKLSMYRKGRKSIPRSKINPPPKWEDLVAGKLEKKNTESKRSVSK